TRRDERKPSAVRKRADDSDGVGAGTARGVSFAQQPALVAGTCVQRARVGVALKCRRPVARLGQQNPASGRRWGDVGRLGWGAFWRRRRRIGCRNQVPRSGPWGGVTGNGGQATPQGGTEPLSHSEP